MVMSIKFNSQNRYPVAINLKNVDLNMPYGKMEDSHEDWRLNNLAS